jgi:hypothetical protein
MMFGGCVERITHEGDSSHYCHELMSIGDEGRILHQMHFYFKGMRFLFAVSALGLQLADCVWRNWPPLKAPYAYLLYNYKGAREAYRFQTKNIQESGKKLCINLMKTCHYLV